MPRIRPKSVSFGRKICERNNDSFKYKYGYTDQETLKVPRMVQICRHNDIILERINLFPWRYPNFFRIDPQPRKRSKLNFILRSQIFHPKY